jgi:two-component system, OmpR family, response regulator CpxR
LFRTAATVRPYRELRQYERLMDRVLIVDNEIEIVDLVTNYLGVEGFEVESAADGEQGIRRSLSGRYLLVILGVSIPDFSGFDVLRRIRAESSVPILIVTASNNDANRILGLESGADDYLPKAFNPRELIARIRAILRRSQLVPQATGQSSGDWLAVGDLELDKAAWVVRRANQRVDLTTVEFQLLETLLRSAGRVLTRQELAEKVLGRHFISPFDRSVDMHVSNLRRKLGSGMDGSDRIKTIRGVGYIYAKPAQGFSSGNHAHSLEWRDPRLKHDDITLQHRVTPKLPSSDEEGMLRPQAVAGVVGCARHPTTPRWPLPAPPLLIQGGDFSQRTVYLCRSVIAAPSAILAGNSSGNP